MIAGLAVLALVVPACGGASQGGSDSAREALDAPRPREPLSAFLGRLDSLTGGDCTEQAKLLHEDLQGGDAMPGPRSREDCRQVASVAKDLSGFRPTQSREFGTAAVSDGTRNGKGSVVVWWLGMDRGWRFLTISALSEPDLSGVVLQPAPTERFDENAAAFLDAIKRRDCAAVWRLLGRNASYLIGTDGTREDFCRGVPGAYDTPTSFYARVAAAPDPEFVRLGRTDNFAFYGIRLDAETYYTLVMSLEPKDTSNPNHEDQGVYSYVSVEKSERGP